MNKNDTPFKQKYALNFTLFCFLMWAYQIGKTYLAGNFEVLTLLNIWLIVGIISAIFTKVYFK